MSLLALAEAASLLPTLLSGREAARLGPRAVRLRRLDPFAQALAELRIEMQRAVAEAMIPPPGMAA